MTPEWNGSDRLPVYGEYVEHPLIPGGRLTVGMPRGRSVTLTGRGFYRVFRNRDACARWLLAHYPEALIYKFDNGVTTCGGTVAERCECLLNKPPSLWTLAAVRRLNE